MLKEKIYARQCEIKEVSLKNYKNFVNKNHVQKYAKAKRIYGLYYKNQIIQIMSFDKPRFNKNYQWEVIRECTKKDYQIIGGTSKLWKYFLKHNSVLSCICYSYPHNGEFTNHYIKYCDFKNIKKSKPETKIYFEGEWNGKHKRIDKSILERHGVDRLLKTQQGQDRTNEQILLDLGFEKKYENGFSPQVDIYYPFSILYRIDDLTDNCFYIGMTERKREWENDSYKGSGKKWLHHIEAHPDHKYIKKILKSGFRTPKDLRDAELKEIEKYVIESKGQKIIKAQPGLMNLEIRTQGQLYTAAICPECGAKSGNHKMTCSQAIICPECGTSGGTHKKTCSQYKKPKPCSECGGINRHTRSCSKSRICSECGVNGGNHKKTCSQWKEPKNFICSECGAKSGNHKKDCSHYKKRAIGPTCSECGGKNGHHFKSCSKFKQLQYCPECGSVGGNHTKKCSQYKISSYKCPECGGLDWKHYKTCSQYKEKPTCAECGGKNGCHKKGCSKYFGRDSVCSECGGKDGKHYKVCSKYKNFNNK